MTGPRRTIAALALLPVLVVVGLFLLYDGSPPSTDPSAPAGGAENAGGPVDGIPDAPETARGGVIEGHVRRLGAGVEARVEARSAGRLERGPIAGRTTAGADGRFRLEGLAAGDYEVRAVAKDRAVGDANVKIPAPGARVRVRIDLPSGAFSLSARAVWADGRPFSGLVRGTAWTETDPDGRFRIRGLEQGTHQLAFLLPGRYRTRGHDAVVPTERELVFVVDEGASEVGGRVIDGEGGAPIPDALVTATGGSSLFAVDSMHRVRTDAEGRFRVRVPAKYRRLAVSAEGYRPCIFYASWDGADEVEIPLDRAHRVTGRVETEAEEPVAGVPVFAVPTGDEGVAPWAGSVSGPDGRFVIEGVSVDDVVVYARGGGWVSRGLGAALTNWYAPLARSLVRGAEAEVRVVVVHAGVIEGLVTDPAGRPVAGAVVSSVPWFEGGLSESTAFRRSMAVETAAGADGRFRLGNALPGLQHDLSVSAPGYLPEKARTSPPSAGGAVGAEIVLSAGSSLGVIAVEAETGAPLAGAVVEAATESGPHFKIVASGTTGEDGRVTIGPFPEKGLIRLRGRHADAVAPGPSAGFKDGPPKEEVRLMFAPGLAIGGSVRFADGAPAAHGRVQTWPHTSRGYPDGRRYAPIGAGGTFSVRGHAPGRCRVEADAVSDGRRHVGTVEVVAGGEDVEIVLAPEPEDEDDDLVVPVRVLDPEGRPVPWASLQAFQVEERTGNHSTSGSDAYLGRGNLYLDSSSGEYWLRVSHARSLSNAPLPLGPVLLGPFSPKQTEIEVRLPPERSITGLVLDEKGRAARGASVGCHALKEEGSNLRDPPREVFTDDDGRFRIGGLGDGDYVVTSGSGDLVPAKAVVRAGAGEVVLNLREPVSVSILVLDAKGAPVPGAEVRVLGSWFTSHRDTTDDAGEVRFSRLTPGHDYELRVAGTRARPGATIGTWIPRDTTVRLPDPLSVDGTVVDATGEPVSEVDLWCLPEGGKWRSAYTDDEGRFRFRGLPPGPVALLALPDDTSPVASDSRAVTVRAGAKDVRLVYRPGATIRFRVRGWREEEYGEAMLFDAAGKPAGEYGIEEEGRIEFAGVDERAVFSLWIKPLDDGRTLFRTGVRAGPEEVVLALESGGTIRGRFLRPASVGWVEIRVEGHGLSIDGTLFPDDSFEVACVPSGKFAVTVEADRDGKTIRASVPASRGDTVELSLGEK